MEYGNLVAMILPSDQQEIDQGLKSTDSTESLQPFEIQSCDTRAAQSRSSVRMMGVHISDDPKERIVHWYYQDDMC